MVSKERSKLMGTEPIGRLLFQFSAPAIVGMVASALYNIVDRMFIGHTVGAAGIGAIAVSFPFSIFIMSSGILIGVGSSSQISRYLGERKLKKAQRVLGNGLLSILAFSFVIMAFGFSFMDPVMELCGASKALLPMASSYMYIVLFGLPFHLVGFGCNYFIRAEGHPRYAMGTLILGALSNVALDWLFILKMGMGVKGAALGTALAQVMAACWVMAFYWRKIGEMPLVRSAFIPNRKILWNMIAIGSSPFMMEMFFMVVMVIFNRTLNRLGGDLAISAMGIFFSLDSMLFMPAMGIGEASQPIIGYNYGAGNFHRVRKTVLMACGTIITVFLCSLFVAEVFPRFLTSLFNREDQDLIDLTVRAMRIGYLFMPLSGITVISGFMFQALGKAKQSILLNMSRQFLFLLPPILILPPIFGIDGVWATFPIVDLGGGILAFFMLRAEMRRWPKSSLGGV